MMLCGAMMASFMACENGNEPNDGSSNGNGTGGGSESETNVHHEAVDLGLPSGLLWATCNVGATTPEEYGDYFAWGETKPKSYYGWNNEGEYKWGVYEDEDDDELEPDPWGETEPKSYYGAENKGEYNVGVYNDEDEPNYGMTKYNATDGKLVLDPEDDAATVNWGRHWRMPTYEEMQELYDNCTWEWTDDYNGTGVAGCIVTSVSNSNSIFLPVAGVCRSAALLYAGSNGYYWSSSLHGTTSPSYAYSLFFSSVDYDCWYCDDKFNARYLGQSVRAVCSPK